MYCRRVSLSRTQPNELNEHVTNKYSIDGSMMIVTAKRSKCIMRIVLIISMKVRYVQQKLLFVMITESLTKPVALNDHLRKWRGGLKML